MLPASLDGRIVVWLAGHRAAPLTEAFVWLGRLEKLGALWLVLALIAGRATGRSGPATVGYGLLTAVATLAADSVSFGVKDLVQRPRPVVDHPGIHPLYGVHSASFPAGHAATAFAGATICTYLARRAWPLFAMLALAVGFSRVYLGVHYPSDVLGGALIGVLVGLLALSLLYELLRRVRTRRDRGGARHLRGRHPRAWAFWRQDAVDPGAGPCPAPGWVSAELSLRCWRTSRTDRRSRAVATRRRTP